MKWAFAEASRVGAHLSGAAAARYILDSAGLQDVHIEMTPGELSDHYDPRHNVLRLSATDLPRPHPGGGWNRCP